MNAASDPTRTANAVDAALADFLERVRVAHERFRDTVARRIAGSLRDSLRQAADGFEAAAARLAAAGEADSTSLVRALAAIRTFRRDALDHVHRPLRDALERLDCGEALTDALAALGEELRAAAAATPERLRRPEPPGTWIRAPGDPWLWAAGKGWVRGVRGVRTSARAAAGRIGRAFRRAPQPVRASEQDVPLRLLADYHVTVRLPAAHAQAAGETTARLGAMVAGLEGVLSEWLQETLALESAVDATLEQPAAGEPAQAGASATAADADPDGAVSLDAALADATRAAGRLRSALNDALRAAEPEAFDRLLAELVARSSVGMQDDVSRIGTFMLREGRRTIAGRAQRVVRETGRTAAEWTAWFRQAVARLGLDIATADFHDALTGSREDLARALQREAIDPVRRQIAATADALGALRSNVERSCTAAREAGDASKLRERLQSIEDSAHEILRRDFVDPLSRPELEHGVRDAAERCIDGLGQTMDGLEAAVVVHQRPAPGVAVRPAARTTRIRAREMAAQAFDAVLLERLRTAVDPAVAIFRGIPDRGRQLEDVVRFNLRAALDEIGAEDAGPAQLDGAEELALNGLGRSIDAVRAMENELRLAVERADRSARAALSAGWSRFRDRVGAEDRVQDQLLDIRYRVRSALLQAAGRARQTVEALADRARRGAAQLRGRALKLLRLGQAAVEGERVSLEQKRTTAEALATLESLLAALPLVYRRLFAFQPVADPSLLVGRDADLDAIRRHFDNWKLGLTDALIVSGGEGSGRTSLLAVARETLLGDTDIHAVDLRDRCLEESEFIALIGPALPARLRSVPTFQSLIPAVIESEPPPRPAVIIVEGLEHALLRTTGGNGLLSRILALMSATDSRIFWIGSISRPAWDYIERIEPMTPKLVRHYPIRTPTRPELEQILMKRHVRSGLPLSFADPAAPSVTLRRRLRRTGDVTVRQAVLRAEYFDRLHRAVGGNISLALFYWLRSAAIDNKAGTLSMREIEPLNFGYLDELSLPQCFALKAFLDHGSLTLDEYGRIFAVSGDEAREMFELLGNLLLIEPSARVPGPSDVRSSAIFDKQRYRIRPLVTHAVTRHLHGRNLLLSPV